MVVFPEIHTFFISAEEVYLEQTDTISTLQHKRCWKCSFQNLTQFSQGNNVLGAPASNIDGFLSGDIFISSTQLNKPMWTKISLSPP
jgi:hypothetical protein